MTKTENNERRCLANDIILGLYKDEELEQIKILFNYCAMSFQGLDKEEYKKKITELFKNCGRL